MMTNWARNSRVVLQMSILLFLSIVAVMGILCSLSSSQTIKYLVAGTYYQKDTLEDALERVSMGNNTVILTVINKAYTANNSVLDLFIESLRHGEGTEHLIKHILFAAFDASAFEQCRARGLHCYKVSTDGVDYSNEELYMTQDYMKMMWRRALFFAEVLAGSYSFIFTDVDILWFRSPFPQLSEEDDVQISCDRYYGQPYNTSNDINAGFFFVRSNKKTIGLFNMLYQSKDEFKFLNEQQILSNFIRDGNLTNLLPKFRFFDTAYFSGFCQKSPDLRKVHTMHANCCRTIKAKMIDLRAHMDAWKSFMATNNTNSTVSWPESQACLASWEDNDSVFDEKV